MFVRPGFNILELFTGLSLQRSRSGRNKTDASDRTMQSCTLRRHIIKHTEVFVTRGCLTLVKPGSKRMTERSNNFILYLDLPRRGTTTIENATSIRSPRRNDAGL